MVIGEKVLKRLSSSILASDLAGCCPVLLKKIRRKRLYKPCRGAYTSFPDMICYRGTQ